MQNPGQTWIFYKAGQTCLTRTKRDPDDLDYQDDPTWFQPWSQEYALILTPYIWPYKYESKATIKHNHALAK